jgi:hypothetical protein
MNFVYIGLIGFGVWMLSANGLSGHDAQFYIKVAASIGGGAFLLVKDNLAAIKSLVPKKTDATVVPVTVSALLPSELENKDHESIVHLRNRLQAADSAEGLEILAKLNDVIFKLPVKAKTVAENKNA